MGFPSERALCCAVEMRKQEKSLENGGFPAISFYSNRGACLEGGYLRSFSSIRPCNGGEAFPADFSESTFHSKPELFERDFESLNNKVANMGTPASFSTEKVAIGRQK